MRYIYICNALPEQVNNALCHSVAGNKFSLNMARAINDASHNKLDFLSLSQDGEKLVQSICNGEIWPGKKMFSIKKGHIFFLSDIVMIFRLMRQIKHIQRLNSMEKITILLENSPMAPAVACAFMKCTSHQPCYSITIDTPFTASFSRKKLVGHINYFMFRLGQKALRYFNGLITFTTNAENNLGISIPCMEFAIGCDKEQLPRENSKPVLVQAPIKTVVYAGTLIYYNCTEELLKAFELLSDEYQLHIYGYGPLETEAISMSEKHSNILFHGRFEPDDTQKILKGYDLLINPRRLDPYIENFTFPSKLIDYILTGKSILSSDFKTMPVAYKDFLYIIEEMTPQGIANAIKQVFEESTEERENRCKAGISYIAENQTYDKIAGSMMTFILQNNNK